MPIYDYKCPQGHEFTQVRRIAERKRCYCKCGDVGLLQVSRSTPVLFKPRWYPDLAEKPLFIETKKQLKEECDRRGFRSTYLMDSPLAK
jgi:putative FmdB family regulatory protein